MDTIAEKIRALKEKQGAVILAHNYVSPEVQDLADFVGDSLELSIKARDAKAKTIVFCGVSFMAETAKLLSPDSKVLHPVPGAGCAMADMAKAEDIAAYRKAHPGTVIVAYVNTTAAAKAEVDLCCTSANAEKVIRSIPAGTEILFLPDRNLGQNVMNSTGRKMELWPGFCPVHNGIGPDMISAARKAHPEAVLFVHPECLPETVAAADMALSTGGMLRAVRESEAKEFIVGTEYGIIHRLKKENPDKVFYPLQPLPACGDMKKIRPEDVLRCLECGCGEVTLPADIMKRARLPVDRMLAL
ncbi:MAG: quinolinate synthase NadA [Lentisphaeria bacterium]|nr:quinolinate synthase NadA [Lentisphaeria bacterium]